jgi:hypothetical protein
MPGIDRESASLLLALIWVETARGTGCFNWNVGNITASDAWAGGAWRPPWFAPSTDPHLAELHARMLAGQAPSAFRAYDSLPEGFADFARVLQHTFPTVLAAARTGDAAAFVSALHDSGYSRDYTARHIATFRDLSAHFAALVSSFPAGAIVAGGGVLAALGLLLVLKHTHRRRRQRA